MDGNIGVSFPNVFEIQNIWRYTVFLTSHILHMKMARSARNPTILATNEFECLFALLCQSHERASAALLHQHRTEGDEDESLLVQTFVQYTHYSLAVALSSTAM
jgi:hypothetical protein